MLNYQFFINLFGNSYDVHSAGLIIKFAGVLVSFIVAKLLDIMLVDL